MMRFRFPFETPYVNTIPEESQPPYPGDEKIEQRIRSILRWNAMAMVVRANQREPGIGGHISTYASSANLYEVAFHHFFKGHQDLIYFQGHATPGIYARAYLEGRLGEDKLINFRRELQPGGGLSSYPHPWLMPDFWEFPTVSMGLAPLQAIYQARFNRYLKDRKIKDTDGSRVWAFLGDGEMDEPESMGSLTIAAREKLDNLTFVINCNLQRLDGPVRGNGKIIQELESLFRGAGWNVIKVIWGRDWDPLLSDDKDGLLVERMDRAVDGDFQKYVVEPGAYARQHFFGTDPRLLKLVENLSDEQIRKLGRGGHDSQKIYAAYKAAVEHRDQPTVIIAKTIKGYGLGDAAEGKNITHQQKKLTEDELKKFRDRFEIPIPDARVKEAPFYRFPEDSAEMQYLRDRRVALGGYVPSRRAQKKKLEVFTADQHPEFLEGTTETRPVSTTMAFVSLFTKLLRDPNLGKMLVPIIPDEARTFGMDPLFRQIGIYSAIGQLYEPVDAKMVLYYREAKEGQLLEEGITEAGAVSSFIAAGTSEASHGVPMIPFYIFYSMFGFQRIGDFIWSLQDSRCRGFLLGGTAGRTTLAGEGLQHQDGHSLLFASAYPRVRSYDPAFAYEILILVREGIRRMFQEGEDVVYYLALYNENYQMAAAEKDPQDSKKMSKEVEEGIVRGLYRFRETALPNPAARVQLLGSGPILLEVLKAQQILEQKYSVAADVWSATSYTELRREALETEHWNLHHPAAEAPHIPWIAKLLQPYDQPIIAVSDWVRAVPEQILRWVPNLYALGTDGFGRSESRKDLRRFFGVDANHIVLAALSQLARRGTVQASVVSQALQDLGIDAESPFPLKM